MELVVGTWNINSINARLGRLLNFLERRRPHLLCLQELKCTEDKFPFEALKSLGYHAAVLGQKSYNGVAVLSLEPLSDIRLGFGDLPPDDARILGGRLGDLMTYSVYVPNGREVGCDAYHYKIRWLERLRAYLDQHHAPTDKVIVAGDFNVAPTPLDLHNPEANEGKVLYSRPEREAYHNLVQWGLVDLLRLKYPEERIYTWWDYRQLAFPKNQGWRIDHILASESVARGCREVWVERDERKGEKPSDHAPVMARLSW